MRFRHLLVEYKVEVQLLNVDLSMVVTIVRSHLTIETFLISKLFDLLTHKGLLKNSLIIHLFSVLVSFVI